MADAALTCIICEAGLDGDTRSAHAFSRSLGGTLQSRETECSGCNEDQGRLEDQLRQQMLVTSAAVGAFDGDGDPITAVVDVPGEGRVRVHAGRLERLEDGFTHKVEGGKRIRWFRAPFDDLAHARKIAAQLVADGKDVEAFDAGAVELVFEPPGPKRLVELPDVRLVIDETSHRVFGKFVLSTLACVDGAAARSGYLDEFRAYVLNGGPTRLQPDVDCRGSGLVSDEETPALAHGAEIWSAQGALYGMVRLFGKMTFTTRMGTWGRPPIAVAYLFDPLRSMPRIMRHEPKNGPGPVALTWSDGSHLRAQYVPWIEQAFERAKLVRGAEPIPPTLERLRPLIRRELEKRLNARAARGRR